MEKEFIPYEQALVFKKLRFNEPCVAIFGKNKELITDDGFYKQENYHKDTVLAPTFSQAFRWFRDEYGIVGYCYIPNETGYWGHSFENKAKYDTYEEAELECLKKLIEIVKENKL